MSKRAFNSDAPIAFFITWTCYGTWLPGDDRGWHKWKAGGLQEPNELFKTAAQTKMKEREFLLTPTDRIVVQDTVISHCRQREWRLHKVNARTNHVHVVVTATGYTPETVRDQLKAWCTGNLKTNYPHRKRFWTEGASCRIINQDDDLIAAIEYAGEVQDRKYLDDID